MLTILLGAVAIFIFGAIWFTFLFGKMWAKLMGFHTEGGSKKGMGKLMFINFLVNIVTAAAVYYIYPYLIVSSPKDFICLVLVMWFAFGFPIYANQAIWEKKSWKLVLLNSAFGIISSIIIAKIVFYLA